MKVHFFEEFPSKENLSKLRSVTFPSVVYVAARSLKEFEFISSRIGNINSEIEIGYWPILKRSYWISPFSYSSELKILYRDLFRNVKKSGKPLKILIDLELPVLNLKLFFVNFFSFFTNKKLIKRIFSHSKELNIEILTAEYPIPSKFIQNQLEWMGVSYSIKKYPHKKIIMFYSSMIKSHFLIKKIKDYIKKRSGELGQKLQIGLGAITFGILRNEPILTPKKLDRDLSFCRDRGIDTVVIFRLGGINKQYMKVMEKYI